MRASEVVVRPLPIDAVVYHAADEELRDEVAGPPHEHVQAHGPAARP